MPEPDLDVPVDASAATDRDTWLALINLIGEEEGYFQTVGRNHWAMFVDDSPTPIVTFETMDQARARQGQMPLAHHIAAAKGWSHLCLISDGQTWFRDPAVYAYFDRLVDDAFFDGFDRVLFYGAGPSAYAACAFCVAAPGAQVLVLNPIATLDPARTGLPGDDPVRGDAGDPDAAAGRNELGRRPGSGGTAGRRTTTCVCRPSPPAHLTIKSGFRVVPP